MTDPTTMTDAALTALLADCVQVLTERAAAHSLIPAPPARPVCPLCNTDADAPTVERLILTSATVHRACSDACDNFPEPGDAADRIPDFIEEHMPDCPPGCPRHTGALATLSRDYPGILTIAAALKAAQPAK